MKILEIVREDIDQTILIVKNYDFKPQTDIGLVTDTRAQVDGTTTLTIKHVHKCKVCGKETRHLGTRLCDACYPIVAGIRQLNTKQLERAIACAENKC